MQWFCLQVPGARYDTSHMVFLGSGDGRIPWDVNFRALSGFQKSPDFRVSTPWEGSTYVTNLVHGGGLSPPSASTWALYRRETRLWATQGTPARGMYRIRISYKAITMS